MQPGQDCRWIAFSSYASNLVSGQDFNNNEDVFLADRTTGAITLVSKVDDTQQAPPIQFMSIAFVLMVLAGLGGLLMVLLSMEERHWKTGHHS